MLPAELMFARKVKSVSDKLLPSRKTRTDNKNDTKSFKVHDKVLLREYRDGKETWEEGILSARIGKLI